MEEEQMAKTLIDVDEDYLAAAQEALHTETKKDTVNAALRGFERRGWIEMHDRAVTVKQPDALGRFAGA